MDCELDGWQQFLKHTFYQVDWWMMIREDLIVLRLEFYSYSMGIVDNKENEEYIWDRNRMDGRHLMPTYILPVQTWTCPPVGVFVVGCPYRKRV